TLGCGKTALSGRLREKRLLFSSRCLIRGAWFSKKNPQHRIYWHCGLFLYVFLSLADSNNLKMINVDVIIFIVMFATLINLKVND
ncbi:MAG: hypothetical protein MJZ34_12150, partial [Paludibacteraceae bacterium]|nr:hypothetical protein [Paludibacteraceae bacterium]